MSHPSWQHHLLARLKREQARREAFAPAPGPATESSLDEHGVPPAVIESSPDACWVRERPLQELWPASAASLARAEQSLPPPDDRADLIALRKHFRGEAVYFDLETCGFAGSTVFLVGLITQRRQGLTLVQLLARDYGEERGVLEAFWEILKDRPMLVSFNGKSFDWPSICDRTVRHRLRADPRSSGPTVHCDLLHHARRRWKGRLPDCRLQTLERFVCGRRRVGDVPGRLIPQVYHDFVRTRDASPMASVLHHNALDLVTLVQLSCLLVSDGGATALAPSRNTGELRAS